MGFLNKHCQLSWEIAVHNCNLIFSGLTDLTQRKLFVSSFENALELGFKQMLLDLNDHSVIPAKKNLDSTSWANYSSARDLNVYFQTLVNNSSSLDNYYSASISSIKNICTNGEPDQQNILNRINLLLKLRNSETHFFIDESNYLSIQEFKELCLLMYGIQNLFINRNIIEHETTGAPSYTNHKYLGYFDKDVSKLTSYQKLIEDGETNQELLKQFPTYKEWDYETDLPEGWWFYVDDINDNYSICHSIFESHGIDDPDGVCLDFLMNLNEFYRRFILMRHQGLIVVENNPGMRTIEHPFVIVSKK